MNLLATGTHTNLLDLGAYGRFKPTGERTTLRLRELIEIQNGQITYSNVSLDVHDLTRQLSILDYDSLISHLDRIDRLRAQLAEAGEDKERRVGPRLRVGVRDRRGRPALPRRALAVAEDDLPRYELAREAEPRTYRLQTVRR